MHEPAVGQQALLIARLIAEDEQEQVLAAARAGVDGRRDALGGAERQAVGLFQAALLGEELIEVAQGLRVGAGQPPGARAGGGPPAARGPLLCACRREGEPERAARARQSSRDARRWPVASLRPRPIGSACRPPQRVGMLKLPSLYRRAGGGVNARGVRHRDGRVCAPTEDAARASPATTRGARGAQYVHVGDTGRGGRHRPDDAGERGHGRSRRHLPDVRDAPGPGMIGRCRACVEEEWTRLRATMGEEWLSEPSRSGMSAIGDERDRG